MSGAELTAALAAAALLVYLLVALLKAEDL